MKAFRTNEDYFSNLPDFPYEPHYLDTLPGFESLRLHYIDEGRHESDASQPVFLCLHGEPTWSYLYRKMIPEFVKDGGRVVAPDFFGFGRSDKPLAAETYTFEFHRQTLIEFIKALDLKNITLVCQDWGGLLGLTLPLAFPERFARLIVMNTMLATGDFELSSGCHEWIKWSTSQTDMKIDKLMKRACPHLSEAECGAYEAPYPTPESKVGVHVFPKLVAQTPDAPGAALAREARAWWQNEWSGQSFMAVGLQDPVLGAGPMATLRSWIRGCPEPLELSDAGHFVQEWGEVVARRALEFWAK